MAWPVQYVLLADLGEFLSAVIPLLIAGGAVAIRFLMERAKAQGPPKGPPLPPVKPQRGGADRVRDEIEDFLRRVKQEKEGNRPVQASPIEARPMQAPPKKKKQRTSKPPTPPPRRAEEVPVEAVVVSTRREGVAEHVSRHLSDAEFRRRANQPGSVDQADEAMAEHVASTLDHRLGSLEGRAGTSSFAPSVRDRSGGQLGSQAPLDVVALLSSNDGLRAAMLLQEILPRPEHRW